MAITCFGNNNSYPIGDFRSGYNSLDANSNENVEFKADNLIQRIDKQNIELGLLENSENELISAETINSAGSNFENIFDETSKSMDTTLSKEDTKDIYVNKRENHTANNEFENEKNNDDFLDANASISVNFESLERQK